ncbi:MAG: FAD-dependent oxidoreductase, partial [Candidatus Acidiferrales bacterium]
MSVAEYDLVVIGSGPAGQKAAINAAKLRKRAAIIERTNMTGGVCVHQGTIPSKTIREAILHLTGFSERTFYGRDYRIKENISVQDLAFRVTALVARETGVIRAQLRRNGVAVIEGHAEFVDLHTIEVKGSAEAQQIRGHSFVIACGTRPAHSPEIPFDGVRILDTDQLIDIPHVPRELIVVGAGVVGLEYCSFFAALGAKVTLIDQRPRLLDYVDHEIVEALTYHLRQLGATFRLGERVTSVGHSPERDKVFAELESGKRVHGDVLLHAVGRQGNADLLNVAAAGLKSDARGKLEVNEFFQT